MCSLLAGAEDVIIVKIKEVPVKRGTPGNVELELMEERLCNVADITDCRVLPPAKGEVERKFVFEVCWLLLAAPVHQVKNQSVSGRVLQECAQTMNGP